ncbi:MAG TPA: transglutaminase-like domain-containing protein [Candidatus Nanoarchaeia archaeon]|nr:transglutaminase-like domain-containing protein [Candidatus Nanoarchaeia archaeon]
MVYKIVLLSLISLLLIPFISAEENLYQYDSLRIGLNVDGGFALISTGPSATVKEVSAELLLYPQEDYRQKLLKFGTGGTVKDHVVFFSWTNPILEKKNFGYTSLIETNSQRTEVKTKVLFPLKGIDQYQKYILPTETIDSDDPTIIAQATELAEGEDDAFKVAFKLASWVEENVKYDLNTLTASASQKASWVLENKEGVCDEMTSLFVAMARAVGIPARFVSGISYTTSELFADNWQPHGWAEVYFPEIGWVSFDIAFGEYGYIDPTHIKLRDGFDPSEPATKYEWLANNVELKFSDLDFNLKLNRKGSILAEEISLAQEVLAKELDFGSYNLIKVLLKNEADYYAATTLQLAIPEEIKIEGRNKRTILLGPKQVKETFWMIKIPENLNSDSWYQFPTLVYSEKNTTVTDSFIAQSGKSFYSQEDIQKLTVTNEEKSYSVKVSFTCNYAKEIKLSQQSKIECSLKNLGNTNLDQVNFCLGDICEKVDLPINQKKSTEITVKAEKTGWNKVLVTADSPEIEKKSSLEFLVYDDPKLEVKTVFPKTIQLDQTFPVKLSLDKKSYTAPEEVIVTVEGMDMENKIELNELTELEEVTLLIDQGRVAKKNEFKITALWKDKNGNLYSSKEEVMVPGEAFGFAGKIELWFNSFVGLFY